MLLGLGFGDPQSCFPHLLRPTCLSNSHLYFSEILCTIYRNAMIVEEDSSSGQESHQLKSLSHRQ